MNMEFNVQNWEQVYDDCFYLFEKIRKTGFQPEIVIGIARGGWIPARLIADFFHLKQTANMKVTAYQMIGDEDVTAEITQPLSADIEGKRVLVIDDVADSGATLQAVMDQIKAKNPAEMKVGVLYYKPRCVIEPDFFIHKTSAWVLFSWSIFEAVQEFHTKWRYEEDMSDEEIMTKLKDIGLPPKVINSYFLMD